MLTAAHGSPGRLRADDDITARHRLRRSLPDPLQRHLDDPAPRGAARAASWRSAPGDCSGLPRLPARTVPETEICSPPVQPVIHADESEGARTHKYSCGRTADGRSCASPARYLWRPAPHRPRLSGSDAPIVRNIHIAIARLVWHVSDSATLAVTLAFRRASAIRLDEPLATPGSRSSADGFRRPRRIAA